MDRNKGLLYFEDGEVKYSKELLSIGIFKALYGNDKHSAKPSWRKWITYLYFAYSDKAEAYRHYLPNDRKKMVCTTILGIGEDEYKELDERLVDCADIIAKDGLEEIEHMMLKLISDMDRYIRYLQDLPWSYEKKVVVQKGDTSHTVYIDVPNDDAKSKALKSAREIIQLKNEYQAMINKELKKTSKGQKKLFEDE